MPFPKVVMSCAPKTVCAQPPVLGTELLKSDNAVPASVAIEILL